MTYSFLALLLNFATYEKSRFGKLFNFGIPTEESKICSFVTFLIWKSSIVDYIYRVVIILSKCKINPLVVKSWLFIEKYDAYNLKLVWREEYLYLKKKKLKVT